MFFRKLNKIVYTFSSAGIAAGLGLGITDDFKRASDAKTDYLKWDSNWDKRDPKALMKPGKENDENGNKPTATRHLLLIRHGQYNISAPNDYERYLTPLGREQAKYIGMRLRDLQLPYDKIIVSNMTRAIETTKIISEFLPDVAVESCQFIHEGAPIQPDPPIGKWKPALKQYYEDGARIEAAFRKHFYRADVSQKKDSFEILVCHANVIRYFICRALQFPPEAWLRFRLNHCSLTMLAIRPSGRVNCFSIGDTGHQPYSHITYSNQQSTAISTGGLAKV